MPSAAGVTIRTWGTKDSQEIDTGISRFAKNYLYHTDYGHASLELTLPDTPENWQMVEKYLKTTGIPYKKEKIEVKKVFYVKGEPVFSEENAYEEDVIRIYFSWWPDNDSPYAFHSLEEDLLSERLSHHEEYAPEWEAYLKPEKRHYRWWLSTVTTLPPLLTLHERRASEAEIVLLNLYQQKKLLIHEIYAFQLLTYKVQSKTGVIFLASDLSKTEQLLFKRFLPELLALDQEYIDVENLVAKIHQTSTSLLQKYEDISTAYNQSIQKFDLEAKTQLRHLMQENPTPHIIKKIKSLLHSHGIITTNQTSFEDILKKILSDEQKARDVLTKISPLIQETKAKVSEYTNQIQRLEDLNTVVQSYLIVAAFAEQRKIAPRAMEKEKQKILSLLTHYFEGLSSNEDILNASLVLKETIPLLKLEKSKKETELQKLNGEEKQAKKEAFCLGLGKSKKLIETHIVKGRLPDHTVNLSLQDKNRPGINPEKMLQQMAAFVTGEKEFKLLTYNCSHTVSEILTAGAEYRGWIFKQLAFSGSVVTPQVVYNNALTYSRSLTPGIELKEVENENSWQNYFAGWAVSSVEAAIDPDASSLFKLWSALNAFGAAATTVTIENATALLRGTQKNEDEKSLSEKDKKGKKSRP